MKKALVTALVHPLLKQGLEAKGWQVVVRETITREQLLAEVNEYQGLVITTRLQIDSEVFQKAKALEWVGRLGSGMEIVDTETALGLGIGCFSSPEGNRDAVAEHCLGMLLSLMHHIPRAAGEVKAGKWIREANRGVELGGKTVGIIGYGNTGSAFARLLEPFGVTVLAHDKYRFGFAKGFVREASLERIQHYANVISLHLPLTSETQHYAGMDFFNALGQQPFFLNASRGGVVQTEALIAALDNGRIAAAGIDVLENEDLSSYKEEEWDKLNRLTGHQNVIVTPHIAGYSQESLRKMAEILLDKLVGAGKL